jgi:tetratricopeptide (TPR) repeat protein
MEQNTEEIAPNPVKKLYPESASTNLELAESIVKQESMEITNNSDNLRAQEYLAVEALESAVNPFLQAAEQHISYGQLTLPKGDNAWNDYQQALLVDPSNSKANAGLSKVRNYLIDNAETAIESGDFANAENWLVQLDEIQPDDPLQADLRGDIKTQIALEAQAKLRQQKEQDRLLKIDNTLAQALEEEKEKPSNYNKIKDLYNRVLELDPQNTTAISGLGRIVDVILDQADLALRDDNLELTRQHIKSAEDLDPTNKRLSSIQLAYDTRLAQQVQEVPLIETEVDEIDTIVETLTHNPDSGQNAEVAAETSATASPPVEATDDTTGQQSAENIAEAESEQTVATLPSDAVDVTLPQPAEVAESQPEAQPENQSGAQIVKTDPDVKIIEDVSADEIAQQRNKAQLDEGIQAYYDGNYNKSFELLYPLAEEGISRAQFRIGVMYKYGRSVSKNTDLSEKWFTLALPSILRYAQQGIAWAQTDLGTSYELGISLNQDFERAAHWYRLAADQEYPGAQTNLGVLYANGEGVDYDRSQAVFWFKKAARQGDLVALENLKVMGVTL